MPVYLSSRTFGVFGQPWDAWLVIGVVIVVLIALAAKKEQR